MAKERKGQIKQRLAQFKRKTKKNKKLTTQELEEQQRLTEILDEESNLIKMKNMGKWKLDNFGL